MKIFVFSAALFSILSSTALGASFDCRRASTPIENAICSDQRLSNLDSTLGELYRTSLALFPGTKTDIQSIQKEWIGVRNKCTNTACLEKAYIVRMSEISNIIYTVSERTTPPPNLTGTYQAVKGTVLVQMINTNTVKFHLYAYGGQNVGELAGNVSLNQGYGIFKSDASSDNGECELVIRFSNGGVSLRRQSGCLDAMGLNVTPDGDFVHIDSAPPKM